LTAHPTSRRGNDLSPAARRPRSHWLLLALLLLTIAAGLLVAGYVHHQVGDAGTAAPGARTVSNEVPAGFPTAGPVVVAENGLRTASPPSKTIALTFDDGPDPKWTPRLLQVLRRYHVPATFFVVGARVVEHPDLVKAEIATGSEVGMHTFTHADLGRASAWRRGLEINLTEHALADAAGITSRLLRPPYSSTPDAVDNGQWKTIQWASRRGLVTVLANRDAEDWKRPGVARIVRNATPAGAQGAIVLLHDAGGDRAQTIAAVEQLIPRLQREGFRFTTVSGAVGLAPVTTNASGHEEWQGWALRWVVRGADDLIVVIAVMLTAAGVLSAARAVLLLALARRHSKRVRETTSSGNGAPRSVSVIIPAYNEEVGIAATVRSVAASQDVELDIIVVDDGSTDDTAAIARGLAVPGLRVVRQENAGKAAALQAGINLAREDIVVLLDGDTVFEPQTIQHLVAPFADPEIGAVAGNTKVGNRRGLLGKWQHLEYVVGFNLDRRLYEELNCMPTVPGAVGAFRKQALDAVGGVPRDTLAEDTDLTIAVLRAGRRIVYAEDARAWTEAPSTLGQLWRQRYRWCYGTLQAMWKHRSAIMQRGAGGHFGRRGLPYLLLFQVLLPLFAPVVDVFAVYGLIFLDPTRVAAVWLAFLLLQLGLAAYALRLDRESLRVLWALPVQQVVYRQMMYLVVIHSVVTALSGFRLPWQKLRRTGLEPVT
jgi:cellulose synthase/poly-beta-1,6-N-acetylglucosamine synthase-like glycosyltransferase/peptidoglycan/xylan/chitin deacetylase (PgdA/CDA1 family)